jgi:prevent-host-death family protein
LLCNVRPMLYRMAPRRLTACAAIPFTRPGPHFSKVVERALKGEPQRLTRYGREAVVIVSEAEWAKRKNGPGTFADLFLAHAGEDGYEEVIGTEPIAKQERPLGSDFLAEDD